MKNTIKSKFRNNKDLKNKITHILGVLCLIAFINAFVSIFTRVYAAFGYSAPADISIASLFLSAIFAAIAIALKRRSILPWIVLGLSLLFIILIMLLFASSDGFAGF